jgi:hypothetical protein
MTSQGPSGIGAVQFAEPVSIDGGTVDLSGVTIAS